MTCNAYLLCSFLKIVRPSCKSSLLMENSQLIFSKSSDSERLLKFPIRISTNINDVVIISTKNHNMIEPPNLKDERFINVSLDSLIQPTLRDFIPFHERTFEEPKLFHSKHFDIFLSIPSTITRIIQEKQKDQTLRSGNTNAIYSPKQRDVIKRTYTSQTRLYQCFHSTPIKHY